MKQLYLLLLFICNISFSQLNLPLKFQEDVVKWAELSWMEGETDLNQYHYPSCTPIIIEDTVYLFENYVHNIFEDGKTYGNCGYSIKKINKNSGEKYWELNRKYKEYGKRKIISQPRFTDNTLEVTLFDEAGKSLTVWSDFHPAHITLSRENGKIIDSNYIDKTNNDLPTFLFNGGNYSPLNGSTGATLYKSDSIYIYKLWNNSTEINMSGQIISIDTFKLPDHIYPLRESRYELDKDGFLWYAMFTADRYFENIQILLTKYNHDKEIDTIVDLTEEGPFPKPCNGGGPILIDSNRIIINRFYFNNDENVIQYGYYLYSRDGEFIDSISYLSTGETFDYNTTYVWVWFLFDKINNRMLMPISRQSNVAESSYLEFFKTRAEPSNRVARIHIEGIKDHFRIQYVTMLDNGDILMYIQQFTDPKRQDQYWYSWIMLDGQKLYQYTATDDLAQHNNKLRVYPNPASDIITIEGLEQEANVTIYNLSGLPVKNTVTTGHQTDISDLPGGMFILEIDNGTYRERHKVIKVQ